MGSRQKLPYSEWAGCARKAMDRSENYDNLQDVAEAIGFTRRVVLAWDKANECPSSAVWAVKGLLADLPNSGEAPETQFTDQELMTVCLTIPDEHPDLVMKARKIWCERQEMRQQRAAQ